MADEKLKVIVDFDARTGGLKKAMTELKALEQMDKRFSSGDRLGAMAGKSSKSLSKWKRTLDDVDKGMKMFGKGLHKFITLALKGAMVEMAAFSAAMLGIHALFASGQFLMKAYNGAMQMVAVGVAGVTVALSAASAAIREQQAAMFAYRGKGAAAFGSGMAQTQMGMRNLQSDVDLATLGVEALNKAYGNMSKKMSVAQINASKPMLKSLMDFGAAGQDPAKGLEQVSVVMQTIADKKKTLSQVTTEYKKLGDEAKKSLKGKNIKSKKDFEDFIMSGEAAKKGGVTGQFSAVNSTLISQLKGYMTLIKGKFADEGDHMLEPLKESFAKIFDIVSKDITRIMLAVNSSFGTQTFLDGFVNAVDKVGNFFVKMVREYLPKSKGMMTGLSDWWTSFRRGWNRVLDYLRPFIEGARVIEKAFSPIWDSIKKGAGNFGLFNKLLQDNKKDVMDTGTRVAGLIDAVSKLFSDVKKVIFSMLPFINDLISGVTTVVQLMSSLFGMVADKGFNQGFAAIFGGMIASKQLAGIKGKLMPGVSTMNPKVMQVSAQQVNINGATGVGPGSVPSTSYGSSEGFSSGATSSSSGEGYAVHEQFDRIHKVAEKHARHGEKPLPTPFGSAPGLGALNDGKISDLKNYNGGRMRGYISSAMEINKNATEPSFLERQARNDQLIKQSEARSAAIRTAAVTPKAASYLEALSMSPLERGGESATDALTAPGKLSSDDMNKLNAEKMERTKLRIKQKINSAGKGVRTSFAGARGLSNFFKSGSINEKGELNDPGAQRAQIDATELPKWKKRLLKNRVNRSTSTKFGSGVGKFNNGMAGRMATGMGLGIASQYAPEEMRGAMALGATVSQMDPLLGIGVAGLGGAWKAKSAGAGMAAGAIGGGAIGAKFGAEGALIGALIGGVFGGIKGAVNKGKAQIADAQNVIKNQLGAFYMGISHDAASKYAENTAALKEGGTLQGAQGAFQNIAGEMAGVQEKNRELALNAMGSGVRNRYGAKQMIEDNAGATDKIKGASGKTTIEMAAEVKKQFGLEATGSTTNFQTASLGRTRDLIGKNGKTNNKELLTKWYKDGLLPNVDAKGLADMLEAPAASIEAMLGNSKQSENLRMIQTQTTARMEALTKATGKSAPELEKMAKEMGFDLYDASMDFNKVLDKMTKGLVKNSQELNNALSDVFLKGGDVFKKAREKREASQTINKSARGLGDTLRAGGSEATKVQATNSFMETYFEQMLSAAGGDFGKAYLTTRKLLGPSKDAQGRSTGNGTAFGKGQEFAGQEKYWTNNQLVQEANQNVKMGVADQYAGQIQGLLAQQGFTGELSGIKTSIAGMSDEQITKLITDMSTLQSDTKIREGGKNTGVEGNVYKKFKKGDSAADVGKLLENAGIKTNVSSFADKPDLNKVSDTIAKLEPAIKGMDDAITLFNTSAKSFMEGPLEGEPAWWTKGLAWDEESKRLKPGDTTSPRGTRIGDTTTSKLSQTMARHEGMNSQLTGKRQITSSFRTNNLGSPSSDHATGAAYDLTGQNLGAYSKLVHQNGGFAEFHGSMATRHLHVVPGPGNLNSTVAPSGATGGQLGAPVTNHYNIHVNGAKHSPQEIAAEVMSHIRREDKIGRERS